MSFQYWDFVSKGYDAGLSVEIQKKMSGVQQNGWLLLNFELETSSCVTTQRTIRSVNSYFFVVKSGKDNKK